MIRGNQNLRLVVHPRTLIPRDQATYLMIDRLHKRLHHVCVGARSMSENVDLGQIY